MEEIRFKEKDVKLCNQSIIEIGYMARDLIQPLAGTREKLFFEEANCYSNVFYLVKDLLKRVDPEYLDFHGSVQDFYKQDLSNNWDRLELLSAGEYRPSEEDTLRAGQCSGKLDIDGGLVGMQVV